MPPSRFDFDVISGPVPPRIPLNPTSSAPHSTINSVTHSAPSATPKPETGK
jgi:hypothetical protein